MTPERDSASAFTLFNLIDPATPAADTTPASINLVGNRKATIILHIGAGGITFTGANKIEFVLTHSDDDATYTNVTDADVIKDSFCPAAISNGIIRSLTAAKAATDVQKLGYIGGKQYLKLLADFSGTHGAGTPMAASCVASGSDFVGAA